MSSVILVSAMQKDIIFEDRPNTAGPLGTKILPNIRKLVQAARRNSIPVLYLNENHFPDDPMVIAMGRPQHCIQGTEGYEIMDELAPEKGDFIVNKRKLTGFFGTDLNIILKDALKVDTIVMTGVLLGFGMYGTILEATQFGYGIIIPTDCATDRTEERGKWVLELLGFLHDVHIKTSDELIDKMSSGAFK